MCACECTWAPVWLSPAVVMVAAFSQHAVGAVWERGEEASRGRRLQARGAVGARCVGCRTGLWKRHHTGAAWTDSYRPSESFLLIFLWLFSTMEQDEFDQGHILLLKHLIYLETAGHWSECSFGRLWFWVGESPDLPTPLTCLNQTHTFNKSVQCPSGCMIPLMRYWPRILNTV